MKQEPLVWKHFDQLVLHDLENAKNAKQKRQIIKCALGLEKRDWNNKEEKTEILLDAFANCYNFAKRHEFTNQSISGYIYQNKTSVYLRPFIFPEFL